MRRVQDENKAVSLKMETGQEEASSARQGSWSDNATMQLGQLRMRQEVGGDIDDNIIMGMNLIGMYRLA